MKVAVAGFTLMPVKVVSETGFKVLKDQPDQPLTYGIKHIRSTITQM
jgi:hypothetical protein